MAEAGAGALLVWESGRAPPPPPPPLLPAHIFHDDFSEGDRICTCYVHENMIKQGMLSISNDLVISSFTLASIWSKSKVDECAARVGKRPCTGISENLTSPAGSRDLVDPKRVNYCEQYRHQHTKSDASVVTRHTAAVEVCNLVYSQVDPVSWDTLSRFYEADAVHGRAVMVLHTSFTYQERTQDIDSIHRAFVKPEGIWQCVINILPPTRVLPNMSQPPPVWPKLRPANHLQLAGTCARSSTVAMGVKLVRYAMHDLVDCAAVLRLGFAQRGIRCTWAGPRAVDYGTLLADGVFWVPSAAARATSHAVVTVDDDVGAQAAVGHEERGVADLLSLSDSVLYNRWWCSVYDHDNLNDCDQWYPTSRKSKTMLVKSVKYSPTSSGCDVLASAASLVAHSVRPTQEALMPATLDTTSNTESNKHSHDDEPDLDESDANTRNNGCSRPGHSVQYMQRCRILQTIALPSDKLRSRFWFRHSGRTGHRRNTLRWGAG
ncbi:hypothetical protein EI94DRAFT_1791920 [Lactarius quietus]|nr:hypothetical protein EI94DRAFT_1791920 [Lactarius quietus]